MRINNLFENKITSSLLAVFCTLLWGTAFPFIKLGYAEMGIDTQGIGAKLLFAGLRFTAAGIMVLIFLMFTDKKPFALRGDLGSVAALGLTQTFAQYLFTYIGIGFTSGANTSIITACASFLTVLAVPLFLKSDRLGIMKILGCVMGFAGVLLVNQGGKISGETLFGDGMIFCSTVCAAAGNIIAKKVSAGRNPVKLTAYQLLLGGLLLTAAGLCAGGIIRFTLKGALILLWLALVSAAAFTIWTKLLKHNPASKVSIFNLLVPVFGTALSGILLGENVFRLETLLSLILISAGIILVNLAKGGERNG